MYRTNFYESTCFRCDNTVYQVDRVGPLKDFTFFHSGCFKCFVCGTKLTLKTYFNNQHRQEDKEVYCSSHVPKIGPGHLDGSSVVIRSALNVPKSNNIVNEQIRGIGKGTFDAEALNIRSHLNGHAGSTTSQSQSQHQEYSRKDHHDGYQYGRFDASALHIAHALRATELQKAYNKAREKPIDYYLVSLMALHFPSIKALILGTCAAWTWTWLVERCHRHFHRANKSTWTTFIRTQGFPYFKAPSLTFILDELDWRTGIVLLFFNTELFLQKLSQETAITVGLIVIWQIVAQ